MTAKQYHPKEKIQITISVEQLPSMKHAILASKLDATYRELGEACMVCEVEIPLGSYLLTFMLGRSFENAEKYRLDEQKIPFNNL